MIVKRHGLLGLLVACLVVAACGATPEPVTNELAAPRQPPPPTPATIPWSLLFVANVAPNNSIYRISSLDGVAIGARLRMKALDLLIMGADGSADYGSATLDAFYNDVKPLVRDVFGSPNLNALGSSAYSSPFNYYVTDYEYSQATPGAGSECNPGLPGSWVPAQNTVVSNMPAWDCNIALSTANVSLNLGMILHRQDLQDSAKYNLFSSEYNSYAAVLHELSHAAFVMSDEAGPPGQFFPADHPNAYLDSHCNGGTACPGEPCVKIDTTLCYRCQPPSDTQNLMYFQPHPTPGVNSGWEGYRYWFASEKRLQFIYNKCENWEC